MRRRCCLALAAVAASLPALPVCAAEPVADPAPASTATPQDAVTEALIQKLVERNALSQSDADALLAKLRAQPASAAAAPAPAAPAPAAASAPATPADKSSVRVMYIPESEKQRIRNEIREDVIATAKAQNWAQPNTFPEWLNRISLSGDFRFRQEFDYFDRNNDPFAINFQGINSGAPFDVNGSVLPPLLNTTQNRELPRIRARLGVDAAVADDLSAGFRFASGNTTNPVSTNQTLGTDFNKVTFVIDRAYLEYRPRKDLTMWLGRMPNPWLSTELVWDDDLNFDGVASRYQYTWTPFFKPFLTVGAFSVENTAFDFPSTSSTKVGSRDKWLFASQLGLDWKLHKNLKTRAGVAYYYFYHLEGALSSPCQVFTTSDSCDTDSSRPAFLQKGNTLFALRDLVLNQSNPNGPQYQYFGLASPFRELNVTSRVDYMPRDNIHVVVDLDYVNNLAYKATDVFAKTPANNFGAGGAYEGGSQGFLAQVLVGYPKIAEAWQWSTLAGYRRIESDAVADAFNDSDFHLGGTNARGYYIQGNLGFTHNAWVSARWLSAQEVSGAPLAVDVVQLEVNARF